MPAQAPKKKSPVGIIIGAVVGVIILLVIIIAVAAAKTDKDRITGVWYGGIDYTDFYEDYILGEEELSFINEYNPDADTSMYLEYNFIFNEDGSMYVNIADDSYEAFMDSYVDLIRTTEINYYRSEYMYFDDMTDEELLDYIDFADTEATLRGYSFMQPDSLNDFVDLTSYKFEDGKLYFYEDDGTFYEIEYTIENDSFNFSFVNIANEEDEQYFQNIWLYKLDSVG